MGEVLGTWLGVTAVCLLVTSLIALTLHRWMERRIHRTIASLRQQRDAARASAALAERASASKGEFLATMSHEIRTPLNSMIGTTELLLDGELTSYQKSQLTTVISSADALLYIINDILDFSKIESGKLMLDYVPFDMAELLAEMADMFAPRVREKNDKHKLEFLVRGTPELPRQVVGDKARIRQILSNLLSNAVKFTADGHISLYAEPCLIAGDDAVRFSVTDTGIGIPEDKREIIFDKFSQAEGNSTTRQFGGTGLGLAISRQLVELMQGDLHMESRPGAGSVFTVEIPLPIAQAVNIASVNALFAGRRALIIDDSMACAESLRQQLGELGIRSFVSDDEETALETIVCAQDAGIALDYIFIEHRLKSTAGLAVAQRMARESLLKVPIIIAMSLLDEAHLARSFERAGCRGFLRKPILSERLRALLEQLEATPAHFVDTLVLHGSAEQVQDTQYPDYHGRRVLLVEDNRVNRNLALEMLAKFHIEAECAEDGMEAVNMAATQAFELILMDCQMPRMDGFEASRLLRQAMAAREIPHGVIIALTANAMKGDRERCLEAGMNDYLCKPLRMQEMKTMLQRWLEKDGNGTQEAAA